MKIARVVCYSR